MHKEAKVMHVSLARGLDTNLVLNKLREKINPALYSVGRQVGNSGISPDAVTAFGFGFAMLAGILYATRAGEPYLGAASIIASGVFDVLDGAVARALSKISKQGSFIDSTLDRLSEIAIYAGIIYGGYGVSPAIVLLALGFSLTVSYLRAKAESIGIKISGIGIGERAERLVALVLFSLLGYVGYGVYVVLILAVLTTVQRFWYVTGALRPGLQAGVA